MFLCRLVHRDQPFQEIDARLVGEGEITVGRDPSADWRLADPDGTLSRIHCTLAVENGRLLLRDRSTNGTFLDSGERAPEGQAVELRVRDSIRLGALTILLTARRTLRWPVLFAGGLLVTAALLLMMQLRVISYAAAFSGPLIAAAMVTILRRLRVRREDVGAAMLASLLGVLAIPYVSGAAVKALGPKGEPETASAAAPGCYDPAAYAALAGLEPGLMAAPIDSGPFILASSRLSVLAAPYHRNGAGLLAAHELLADTPEGALARVRALKVRYVAVCPMGDVGRLMKSKPDSLAARLEKNETPPWLSQVKTESSVRAYQVKDIY